MSRSIIGLGYPTPSTIYPEIHLVADSAFSAAFGYSVRSVTEYFAVTIVAANLRYASLRSPKVQLRICGITMNTNSWDEPYIMNVPGYQKYRNILFMETLEAFNTHMKQKSFYYQSDIVFLVTAKNMSEWEGNKLNHSTGGYAYIGTACSEWRVGMCEDRPTSYYGVYVLTHEIAHNLGCNHDQEGASTWVEGHIGSSDCPWKDGYIMSYEMKDKRQYSFSRCCAREIGNLYKRPAFKCLREINSKQKIPPSKRLPGQMTSLSNYCQRVYMYKPGMRSDPSYGIKGVKDCKVKCLASSGTYWTLSVVDGTPCNQDKTRACIFGECVPLKTEEDC